MGMALFAFAPTQNRAYAAETPAFIRLVHASPDIGTADVFLDGKTLLSNFEFGTITNYASIPPGPHKVQVSLIGKGPNAASITQTLSVSAGLAYTVAALGTSSGGFSLQVFVDNNQLAPGAAKVRFYHLSPGTGTVSVSNGSSTLIQGLSYTQASEYLTTSPGSYTFQAVSNQPSVNLSLPVTLNANTVVSEFAVGVVHGMPPIQFVSSQTTGLPGLPGTGSDPYAVATPVHTEAFTFPYWSLIALLALLLVVGMGFWRVRTLRRM